MHLHLLNYYKYYKKCTKNKKFNLFPKYKLLGIWVCPCVVVLAITAVQ